MAKKKKGQMAGPNKAVQDSVKDQPVTLKELLNSDVLDKLKSQAEQLKLAELERQEAERRAAEDKKAKEQKARENDFAYLLENSDLSWGKYKS